MTDVHTPPRLTRSAPVNRRREAEWIAGLPDNPRDAADELLVLDEDGIATWHRTLDRVDRNHATVGAIVRDDADLDDPGVIARGFRLRAKVERYHLALMMLPVAQLRRELQSADFRRERELHPLPEPEDEWERVALDPRAGIPRGEPIPRNRRVMAELYGELGAVGDRLRQALTRHERATRLDPDLAGEYGRRLRARLAEALDRLDAQSGHDEGPAS